MLANVTYIHHWNHRGMSAFTCSVDLICPSMKSRHIIPFLSAQNELSLHLWSIPFISTLTSSYVVSALGGCAGALRVHCHHIFVCLFLRWSPLQCVLDSWMMSVHPVNVSSALIWYNVHVQDPETGVIYWSGRWTCREQAAQVQAWCKL